MSPFLADQGPLQIHGTDSEIGGVVEEIGVVQLLNKPYPKSNNPKAGLLRLALDFGHPNLEIV